MSLHETVLLALLDFTRKQSLFTLYGLMIHDAIAKAYRAGLYTLDLYQQTSLSGSTSKPESGADWAKGRIG